MNRLQIFLELRRHRLLADKRSLDFARNKAAKWVMAIVATITVIYLMGFAVMFAFMVNSSRSLDSVEMALLIAPFLLTIDFLFRFIAQQTPAQLIRPYLLINIPRYACIESFLITTLCSWSNLTWFFFLVPYALMSVVFTHGIGITVNLLLLYLLMILVNSQWYLLVRTLINDRLIYWLLPLSFYLLVYSPLLAYLVTDHPAVEFTDFYEHVADALLKGSLWPLLAELFLLIVMLAVNRQVQHYYIWKEISHSTSSHHVRLTAFRFLDHYGIIGQYIKLEVKSILRNKNPRKSFIFSTAIVVVMSLAIAFTDVYDGDFMTNFWCVYNYVIFGGTLLQKIMSYEGNYIDCLMIRKENILHMLEAKYIFYSALLLLPFTLMLPPVFSGKWSLLMLISYGLFTAGFQFFVLFQMAVYNHTTLPLNSRLISSNGIENNYIQFIVTLTAFGLPLVLVTMLESIMSNTAAYLVMMAIGLTFIFSRSLWLRNIYNRMMAHKYEIMEGLHSTR